MYHAGLDIGTTVVKGIIFDQNGREMEQAHREYDLHYPKPGWRELDSDSVWSKTREVLKELGKWEEADSIQALSVSVQGEAVTPISADGQALYNSVVTFDNRTIPQAEWWESELGREKIFSITGQPLHPMTTLNKIMWFRDNMHRVYQDAWKFLCYEDLFFFRLGLDPVIDHSLASRTMAFDIIEKEWSDLMTETAGIDQDLLADPRPSGEVVGELSSEKAKELGLPAGLAVVTGGHDQPCSALGGGAIANGTAVDSTGTVECVTPAMDEPILNQDMLDSNFPCYCHVKKGMFVTLAFHFGAGSVLKWYRDNYARTEVERSREKKTSPYELLDRNASEGPVDVYVLPHFVGTGTPYLDPKSKGAILGLTTSTTRNQIYKAILDGITYETRINLERLEGCGVKIKELRAIGGGANSPIWLDIKANILNRKIVKMTTSEAGCLGAAMLAATATGYYPSLEKAVKSNVRSTRRIDPDPVKVKDYQEKFAVYRDIYDTIKEISWSIPG